MGRLDSSAQGRFRAFIECVEEGTTCDRHATFQCFHKGSDKGHYIINVERRIFSGGMIVSLGPVVEMILF